MRLPRVHFLYAAAIAPVSDTTNAITVRYRPKVLAKFSEASDAAGPDDNHNVDSHIESGLFSTGELQPPSIDTVNSHSTNSDEHTITEATTRGSSGDQIHDDLPHYLTVNLDTTANNGNIPLPQTPPCMFPGTGCQTPEEIQYVQPQWPWDQRALESDIETRLIQRLI